MSFLEELFWGRLQTGPGIGDDGGKILEVWIK